MSLFRPIRSAWSHAPANTVQRHPGSVACVSQSAHAGPTVGFRLSRRPRGAERMSSKLSRNFPTLSEASGAYILSARQEWRLTRKRDARQRRTWKSYLEIIPHLQVVRETTFKFFIPKTQIFTNGSRKSQDCRRSQGRECFNVTPNLHILREFSIFCELLQNIHYFQFETKIEFYTRNRFDWLRIVYYCCIKLELFALCLREKYFLFIAIFITKPRRTRFCSVCYFCLYKTKW
jgi:hypothetical protein